MRSLLNMLGLNHKNNKALYYAIAFARELMPGRFFQKKLHKNYNSLLPLILATLKKE